MRYKDTKMSLKEIAAELNVANILEGSIQRTGNKIRVVGQLIETRTDNHLWSETYDKDFNDIFSIQTSIAKEIASALKSQITENEKSVIEEKLTDNIDAYEMYLKVKKLRREGSFMDSKIRKELLKKILGIDPDFTEALALLSIEYSESVHFGINTSQKRKEKAKLFIEKAFSIKPESAAVRFAYGYYYYGCFKDYLRALEHYQFALSKEPGNADFNAYIGYVHRRLGNWTETLKYLEKAASLDPNDLGLLNNLFGTYLFLKQYNKLNYIELDKKAYKESAENGNLYTYRARFTFRMEGNTMNARKIIKASQKLIPDHDYYRFGLIAFDHFDQNYTDILDYYQTEWDSIIFSYSEISPKYSATGYVYWLMDDEENKNLEYQKALDVMLNLQGYEVDARYHSKLGIIYAMLNKPEKAVQEAKLAISLAPPTIDIFASDAYEYSLGAVYALIGEYDKSLDIMENLLSEPSNYNWYDLKYDPGARKIFKNNARFNTMIQKDEDRFKREATYDLGFYLP